VTDRKISRIFLSRDVFLTFPLIDKTTGTALDEIVHRPPDPLQGMGEF